MSTKLPAQILSRPSGSLMSLLLFAIAILSIFLASYFRFFQESANLDQKLQHQQIARQAAVSINEEALIRLRHDAFCPDSKLAGVLLNAIAGSECDIQLPFSSKYIGQLIPQGYSCEFASKVRILGFTKLSPDGKLYVSEKEGHGIAAMTSMVTLRKDRDDKNSILAAYKLETHLDYLVTSIFPVTSEHPAFDKALIVRTTADKQPAMSLITNELQISFKNFQRDDNAVADLAGNFLPYQESALWACRNLDSATFDKSEFIDHENRRINLRGIVHCIGKLKLSGNWEIYGRGVLMADSFEIDGSVSKPDSKDFAIFFARNGDIIINTDLPIYAGLIAINSNHSGTILAKKSADIQGFIMVDRLSPLTWARKPHSITRNPVFGDLIYAHQILIGDWINFRSHARHADAQAN